ncbi:hypothetical protein OAX78_00675 [Planctomycetota bacterium]|nr:hypothetical protein [Planctomycetota bacterium]
MSRYYADDKDVRDVLEGRLNPAVIASLLRRRGVLVNPDMDDEDFYRTFLLFGHSHYDVANLLEATERGGKGPSTTIRHVKATLDLGELFAAAKRVQRHRAKTKNETWRLFKHEDPDHISIDLTYAEFDWKRTRLYQKRIREAHIRVQRTPGKTVRWAFRLTDAERAIEIVEEIRSAAMHLNPGKKIELTSIGLEGITQPALRTKFLFDLMTGIKNFALREISEVQFANVSGGVAPPSSSAATVAGLNKAILKGTSINKTSEYESLKAGGHYVSSAVWEMDPVDGKGYRYECEAGFGTPETASNFGYRVRWVYRRIKQGKNKGELKRTRAKPTTPEESEISGLLERAAEKAQETVTKLASS